MLFLALHIKTQNEIRAIEARKQKARALKAQELRDKEAFIQAFKSGEIIGFTNPLHDVLFKLTISTIRALKKS